MQQKIIVLKITFLQNGENSPLFFLILKKVSGEFSPPGDSHKNPAWLIQRDFRGKKNGTKKSADFEQTILWNRHI